MGALEAVRRIEDIDIRNGDGRLRLRVYSATDDDRAPAVLAFHGGGWVIGDLLFVEGQCRQLANAVGCRVISVEYCLAPEHPFPAAAEDAYTVCSRVRPGPSPHSRYDGREKSSSITGYTGSFMNLTKMFPRSKQAFDDVVDALRGPFGLVRS
jgi:hypothetical protein